jgi:hypothetical protein
MLHAFGQGVTDDADVIAFLEFKALRGRERGDEENGETGEKVLLHVIGPKWYDWRAQAHEHLDAEKSKRLAAVFYTGREANLK